MENMIYILPILAFVVIAAFMGDKKSRILKKIEGFSPTIVHQGGSTGPSVAIDATNNKFAIIYGRKNAGVFDFRNLIAIEICRNGTSIDKTNRGSQVVGAAIGAVLLGPIGLLLGGLTGSKRREENIKRLSLKLFTSDIKKPVHEIIFFDSPKGLKPESSLVKSAADELDEWHGRFKTILHMSAQASEPEQLARQNPQLT